MTTIEVRTQAALDKALAKVKPGDIIALIGNGYFDVYGSATVRAYGSATVRAYGSATVRASDSATVWASDSATVRAYDSATVWAYGSATVRAYDSATVWAYGSATVRASGSATVWASGSATVRAYGSATVRAYDSATVWAYDSATVWAYGSATVRAYGSATVRAYDSATVRAYGSATVRAGKYVAVYTDAGQGKPTITGGVLIHVPEITSVETWCDLSGIDIIDGRITVYKALDADLQTPYSRAAGITYTPGTSVEAPDWNPVPQCGGGLHVAASPGRALEYHPTATRFVSMSVAIEDVRVPLADEDHGKVKVRRVSDIAECDIHGRAL